MSLREYPSSSSWNLGKLSDCKARAFLGIRDIGAANTDFAISGSQAVSLSKARFTHQESLAPGMTRGQKPFPGVP